MKSWPVPDSYSKNIPVNGSAGAFWEDRGDRRHCGIDIYASPASPAVAVEEGTVIDIGTFTSRDRVPYWNDTKHVLIENKTGRICRYAELGDVVVDVDESIEAGQLIGNTGVVLDLSRITADSPPYIQKLTKKQNLSMLHFELYSSPPEDSSNYLGGNWFGSSMPENLLDSGDYLNPISCDSR